VIAVLAVLAAAATPPPTAELGGACGSTRLPGAMGLALLAFASRRRRSRVPLA
jgi:hypothetical protein